MVEKLVNQFGKLSLGLGKLWVGDPTGAVAVAEAGAFAYDQMAEAGKRPDQIFLKVLEDHRAAWEPRLRGATDREAAASVLALLEGEIGIVVDKRQLVGDAFDPRGLTAAATPRIVAALGITAAQGHPEIARHYATELIGAGLTAAMGALYPAMAGDLAFEQARQTGLVRDEVGAGFADILAKLDTGTRDELLAAAHAFGFDQADARINQVRSFLTEKAEHYKRLEAQIEALGAADGLVGNLLAAARTALDGGHFDEARARIADARAMQRTERTLPAMRREAELFAIEAESFLLQGEVDLAAEALEAGAGLFAGVDRQEEATVRNAAALRLNDHALRFGGPGFLRAIELYRSNETIWTRAAHPVAWAGTQNNLGNALNNQAARTEGAAGAGLLGEAVAAYRAALEVYTRAAHPVDWAMTRNNLGNVLADQAARTEGAAGAGLLDAAVAAYRAALEIRTRAEQPVDWAETRSNLGVALWAQAARTEGAPGAGLLGEAVAAYRAALEVYTRAGHPVDWATTQNNLGIALVDNAARTEAAAGAGLLGEAVAAYRAALEVRTRAAHPVDWATTQNNLGIALGGQAARAERAPSAGLLGEAVTAYRAALEVTTRAAHPVDWAMTQNNLGNALGEQAARTDGAAGAGLLDAAAAAYRAALEVRTRAAHPVDWAMTQNNLGNALGERAARTQGAPGAGLLGAAVAAYRAALEVRTRAAHPVGWAMTQENLGLVFEEIGDREAERRAEAYKDALECFDAALSVFGPAGMAPNHEKCSGNRARVAAKLAELD